MKHIVNFSGKLVHIARASRLVCKWLSLVSIEFLASIATPPAEFL